MYLGQLLPMPYFPRGEVKCSSKGWLIPHSFVAPSQHIPLSLHHPEEEGVERSVKKGTHIYQVGDTHTHHHSVTLAETAAAIE
jgi:hypothetical protein